MKFFDPTTVPVVNGIQVICRPMQTVNMKGKEGTPYICRESDKQRRKQQEFNSYLPLWPQWSVQLLNMRVVCYSFNLKDALKIAHHYRKEMN